MKEKHIVRKKHQKHLLFYKFLPRKKIYANKNQLNAHHYFYAARQAVQCTVYVQTIDGKAGLYSVQYTYRL